MLIGSQPNQSTDAPSVGISIGRKHPLKTNYTLMGAEIEGDYRYRLWRHWATTDELIRKGYVLFIMLNPSTADGNQDDNTIRRCVNYSKSLNYGKMMVVNLFAYRTSKPADLYNLPEGVDPIGERNNQILANNIADAGMVICAWGTHGGLLNRQREVLKIVSYNKGFLTPKALKLTKGGFPGHPLYLKSDIQPFNIYGSRALRTEFPEGALTMANQLNEAKIIWRVREDGTIERGLLEQRGEKVLPLCPLLKAACEQDGIDPLYISVGELHECILAGPDSFIFDDPVLAKEYAKSLA